MGKKEITNKILIQNVIECRFMTNEFFNNIEENILLQILGDNSKLSDNSILVRDSMFNYLKTKYNNTFNYWMEIRPDTNNEIRCIHILKPEMYQAQWNNFENNILIIKVNQYRIYKFPQFGFDIRIYE